MVASLVGAEAQCAVGLHGVQALVLQGIGSELVAQADAPPLLRHIQEHAAARREDAQAPAQLFTTIAAETAEQISGEAGRMNPHRHRIRPAFPGTDEDRHVLEDSVGLTKQHEAGILGHVQRNRAVADVGHLDLRVLGHGGDLRRGYGEDRAAVQRLPQPRGAVGVHGNAHDGGEQPAQPRQGQAANLRGRGLSQVERVGGVLARGGGQAQNLLGAGVAVQAQAQVGGLLSVGARGQSPAQTHGVGPVVRHGQTERSAGNFPEVLQRLAPQAIDCGQEAR